MSALDHMQEARAKAEADRAKRDAVLDEVWFERAQQNARWGEQNHEDGTDIDLTYEANIIRDQNDRKAGTSEGVTWLDILREEVAEAACEESPDRLRKELIQVAAVAVAWIECIDRRNNNKSK